VELSETHPIIGAIRDYVLTDLELTQVMIRQKDMVERVRQAWVKGRIDLPIHVAVDGFYVSVRKAEGGTVDISYRKLAVVAGKTSADK
jgi:hypothetical protein